VKQTGLRGRPNGFGDASSLIPAAIPKYQSRYDKFYGISLIHFEELFHFNTNICACQYNDDMKNGIHANLFRGISQKEGKPLKILRAEGEKYFEGAATMIAEGGGFAQHAKGVA